jgi:hypothetical protein
MREIAARRAVLGWEEAETLWGDGAAGREDVTLIRHAYVPRRRASARGVGGK